MSDGKPAGILVEQPDIAEDGGSWWYVLPAMLREDPEPWDRSLWEADLEVEPLDGPFDTKAEAEAALKALVA